MSKEDKVKVVQAHGTHILHGIRILHGTQAQQIGIAIGNHTNKEVNQLLVRCLKCHSFYSEFDEKCPFCGENGYEYDKDREVNDKAINDEGKKYRYITSIEKLEEYYEKDIEAFDGIYIGILRGIFDDIKHNILITSRIFTKAEWEMIETDKARYDKSRVKYPFDSSISKENRLTIMKKYMSLFHTFDNEKDYMDAIEILKKYRKYESTLLQFFTREELDMVYAEGELEDYYECSVNGNLNLNRAMIIIDKVNSIDWTSFDMIDKRNNSRKKSQMDSADNDVIKALAILTFFVIPAVVAFLYGIYTTIKPIVLSNIPAMGSYYDFRGTFYFRELDNDWYQYNYPNKMWIKDNNVPVELKDDSVEYKKERDEQVRGVKLKDLR